MSVKSKTQLKADNDSLITTNGAGDITGAILNGFEEDIIDSYEDFIGTYTTAQINALVGMTTRQIVYDSDEALFKYYTGVRWVRMCCPKYKVYTALLTQTGTNAPVATVLENTLGGTVVWSYVGVGIYSGILSGAFTSNKTFLLPGTTNGIAIHNVTRIDQNEINVNTWAEDGGTGIFGAGDGILSNSPIEIRVYY